MFSQDAMTKLYGAVLFNIVGLIAFNYYMKLMSREHRNVGSHHVFGIIKSICAIVVSILYYSECFQA